MNTDKHTCVCATCGQGFTRKTSAARHNNNLHHGKAIIVKPYDYIVGRLSGEYSPGDPAIYRSNWGNRNNSSVYNQSIQTNKNYQTNITTRTDTRAQELHLSNSINPIGQEITPYHSLGTPRWPLNTKRPYASNQLKDHELKLDDELKMLLYRNFPPHLAAQLFEQNSILDNTPENNNYLGSIMNWYVRNPEVPRRYNPDLKHIETIKRPAIDFRK